MASVDSKLIKVVHVVGDSHALGFKGRSIVLPDFDLVVTTDVAYVRGLDTEQLVQGQKLHPNVVHYFLQQNIITKEGVKAAAATDALVIAEQYSGGTGFQRPIVMFIAGEIFLRRYLGALHANPDFKLSEMHEKLRQVAEKFVVAVRAIHESFGVYTVVHELSPPTGDDDAFERVNNFRCPRELRAMLYRAFNKFLCDYSTKFGIAFCNSSDYLSAADGCLAKEYEFDGVHADPKFVPTSLERSVSLWMNNRWSERTDRYFAWCDQSGLVKQRAPISMSGVAGVMFPFTPEQIDTLRQACVEFEAAICKKPALDWAGAPPTKDYPKFNESLRYGHMTQPGLQVLHDVLVKGSVGDTLRAMFGAKFSVVNVRPVHSMPHDGGGIGQQAMHRDGCPPGVYRGLIYLTDVDESNGPFEYLPDPKASGAVQITGKAGASFFFDANAVLHRATPPRKGERLALDLIFLVQPETCQEIVHSRNGFSWPVDPYLFGLSEHCYPRVAADRWFYPELIFPKDPRRGVKSLSADEMASTKKAG